MHPLWCWFRCCSHPPKLSQLNKELAVNRDTGKKHQEAPSEKLVRKFKENPFLPIGGKAQKVYKIDVYLKVVELLLFSWWMAFSSLEEKTVKEVRWPIITVPKAGSQFRYIDLLPFLVILCFSVVAENDARQNCCSRIYRHGPANRHYGFGKQDIALTKFIFFSLDAEKYLGGTNIWS